MERLVIKGGKKLKGTVEVAGSKNVALKALVAACLTQEEVIIENIPLISDVFVMTEVIRVLGGEAEFKDHILSVKMKKFDTSKILLEKAAEIRTSFMFLAPLLSRTGKAIIPNPGGCRIGARPIDRVINGLKKMGVSIKYQSKDGYFHAYVGKGGLKGIKYKFSKNTHTGTEALIMTAVLAEGRTVLENAAQEPEVDELINFLNQMGAKIRRVRPRIVIIDGVEKLHGAKFRISPDRNEVVTFAIAAILTEGEIFIKKINKLGLLEFLDVLAIAGGGFEEKEDGIRFYYKGELNPTKVTTFPYPGFMTDWQAPWSVLMTKAQGASIIHETVYENRFNYVEELQKMGGNFELYSPKVKNPDKVYNFNVTDDKNFSHAVKIYGPTKLHNGMVMVSDLRAGATLVLAALAAEGESVIFGLEHLDRGYEEFDKRLKKLGADIERVSDE
ncbi:MAG TPA: UDP-N-acetylglucosamine 1-carboxyvinyltransferase [Patescibacteria group bacterium]|nr:UDP-N-acetylglucosamine 1-carboxyvinyltransferase [Patescibacteria group bacterium]